MLELSVLVPLPSEDHSGRRGTNLYTMSVKDYVSIYYRAIQLCKRTFLQKRSTPPLTTPSSFQGLEKGGDELVSPQVTK